VADSSRSSPISLRAQGSSFCPRAAELELQLFVNNAGVAAYGPFASASAEGERGLVRLNVEAIIALTRELLPQLLARGRGGIINVASQMAFQPMPYFASYAASKAFVLSFSEASRPKLPCRRPVGNRFLARSKCGVRT
jgi:short-subunit dehydrogenase